jgi:N-acylneuraminate cytidylyltransferase
MRVAFIFARGGSKGLANKNLLPFCGEPLVARAVRQARESGCFDRVVVSTDSPAIADMARSSGADVPFMRPAELATDTAPEWLAWQHAIRAVEAESAVPMTCFASVPATAPLRQVNDLRRCVSEFEHGDADVVVTGSVANRNPYFNMVVRDDQGLASLVCKPVTDVSRRQDAPDVYDLATVAYVASPRFVLSSSRLFQGRVRLVVLPKSRCVDIDDAMDLKWAEFLAREGGPDVAA